MADFTREEVLGKLEEAESLEGADLSYSCLADINFWFPGYLSRVNLKGADLSGAFFDTVDLRGADLSCTDLNNASFTAVNLRGADLRHAEMTGAAFENTDLRGADLTGATLYEATIRGSNSFAGADLAAVNLAGANLENADLSDLNLEHVNFAGANLVGANLGGANLQGADLTGAWLSAQSQRPRSRFPRDSHLASQPSRDPRYPNYISYSPRFRLEGADLEGANLKGAVLPEYFEIANEVKPHSCVSCGKLIEQEFRFCPDCGQKAHLLGSSDDAKPYFNRGCTYHELRQYERAIEDYDRAIELYPGYARAFFNRGCAVLEMHFADEKINRHSRFLSPSISKSRFARGIEDYERAIKDYDRAVELDPDYAPTYNYRGWAYHNLKQHRRAIQDYDTAIKLQPKSVTYENRGNAYHTLGDGERGESDLVTARKLRQYENQSSAKTNEMKNNFTWPRSETPEGWVHFSPNWWLSPVRRRQIRLGFRNTHEVEEFIERLEFIDSLGPLDTYGLKFGSQDYQYYVFLFQEYAVAECPQYGNSVFLLEGTGDWQDIFNRSIQDLRRTPYSIDNSIRGRVSWIRHTKTWQQRLKHYLEEKPKGREEGPPERQLTPEQRAPRRAPRTGFRPKPIGFRPKPTGFRPKPINELDETEVVFPDRKLEQAIREKFEKPEGVLNRGDLKRLKELVVEETEIEDITGLEHAVNLTELWLGADLTTQGFRENQITDISSLAGLTNLTSLELGFNQISDITPLEGLTNLTELFLRDNQISDISPLEELTSLARLDLRHNQISSISPLKSHSNLNYFIVDFNPLSRESLDVHIPELQARGVRVYFRQPLLEKEAPSERPPRSGYGGLFEDM